VGRRGAIACGVVVVAAFCACNALTGVGDLQATDCIDGCDGSVPVRTGDDGGNVTDTGAGAADAPVGPLLDAAPKLDATTDADAGTDASTTKPTYCQGITIYLPMDGSLTAKSGQTADAPVANVSYVAGKFGQGADFTDTVAVYYTATFGAKSVYSLSAGTVAMWVKPSWTPPCPAIASLFFKPRAVRGPGVPNAGPVLECSAILGMKVDTSDAMLVNSGYAATPPNWNAGTWNHVVGIWGSTAPTMGFSVNGALPLTVATPWVPNESPPSFLRLGSEVNSAKSVIDEVIVWTRVLSASEIAALAASPVSTATACGL
jgi:hypothetical protein